MPDGVLGFCGLGVWVVCWLAPVVADMGVVVEACLHAGIVSLGRVVFGGSFICELMSRHGVVTKACCA